MTARPVRVAAVLVAAVAGVVAAWAGGVMVAGLVVSRGAARWADVTDEPWGVRHG